MPTNTVKPLQWWDYNRDDPLADGLVGYWPFWERMGLTAHDVSGKGNNGTLVNGPTWVPEGLSFDGSNDHVDISSDRFNLGVFSIWGVVCPNSTGSSLQTIMGRRYSGSFQYQFRYIDSSNALSLLCTGGSTTSSLTIPDGEFTSIGATFDGTNVSFFAGNRVDINSGTTSVTLQDLSTFIGATNGSPVANLFGGVIKQTAIWDRVLSPEEYKSLYEDQHALIRRPTKTYLYYTAPVGTGSPWYNNLQELIA